MVEGCRVISVGRFHIDGKGAGRVYIPKEVAQKLKLQSGERILIILEGTNLVIKPLLEEADEGGCDLNEETD